MVSVAIDWMTVLDLIRRVDLLGDDERIPPPPPTPLLLRLVRRDEPRGVGNPSAAMFVELLAVGLVGDNDNGSLGVCNLLN